MRCGRRVCAAKAFAAAIVGLCLASSIGTALAEENDDPRLMLFSGRDIWHNGIFLFGGLLIAPNGFEDDGPMLKLLMSGGVYRYNAGDLGGLEVYGAEWLTQIMPGWRMKNGNLEVKIFFGFDTQFHRLWPDDPGNPMQGRHGGVRFSTEFWDEPTPSTLIAGDASFSSVGTSNSARLAFGWKVLEGILDDGFYFGPEVQYYGAVDYRQSRLGLHITSMKVSDTEWLAAGGWAKASDGTSSLYLRLGLSRKQ